MLWRLHVSTHLRFAHINRHRCNRFLKDIIRRRVSPRLRLPRLCALLRRSLLQRSLLRKGIDILNPNGGADRESKLGSDCCR